MRKKILSILLLMTLLLGLTSSTEVDAGSTDPLIIVLDPGHGGTDPGAICTSDTTVYEKEITLKIANYMKAALDEYANVEVYLTRDDDSYVSLMDRVEFADDCDADIMISLHINSSTSTSASGAEVYYPNGNYVSNYDTSVSYSEVKSLAQDFLDGLVSLGLKSRGILIRNALIDTYPDGSTGDYYTLLRESKNLGIPVILIEHAFLSNTSDYNNYLSTNSQIKKLALSNVEAIVEAFDLTTFSAEITITAPDITEYIVGDTFDPTGITVSAKYSDGTKATLTSDDYTITGFDSSSTGNKVMTITHYDATAKFVVTILPSGSDVNSTLLGDVNGDGEIKASDYLIIKDSFLEGITLSANQISRADVKQDGEIKASDYLMIKDYFLGTLASLPELEVDTDTETDSTTDTDTSTDSTTDTDTDSDTDSTTSTDTDTSTDSTTSTDTDTSTDSTTNTDTDSDTDSTTNTDTDSDTDSTTDTDTDSDTDSTTDTDTDSDTDSISDADSSTDSTTDTN